MRAGSCYPEPDFIRVGSGRGGPDFIWSCRADLVLSDSGLVTAYLVVFEFGLVAADLILSELCLVTSDLT